MDNEKLTKLQATAKRTLKILKLLEEGFSDAEIMEKLGVERQLVHYYRKALKE